MQSHGLICIKVRICDKHVDHSSRKRGILGNNHILRCSDTLNIQESAELEMRCCAVVWILRSSMDTAQLITASIHQNTFI